MRRTVLLIACLASPAALAEPPTAAPHPMASPLDPTEVRAEVAELLKDPALPTPRAAVLHLRVAIAHVRAYDAPDSDKNPDHLTQALEAVALAEATLDDPKAHGRPPIDPSHPLVLQVRDRIAKTRTVIETIQAGAKTPVEPTETE